VFIDTGKYFKNPKKTGPSLILWGKFLLCFYFSLQSAGPVQMFLFFKDCENHILASLIPICSSEISSQHSTMTSIFLGVVQFLLTTMYLSTMMASIGYSSPPLAKIIDLVHEMA